jgi:DNA-directed RNA polymerase specialized sigma24 family protein
MTDADTTSWQLVEGAAAGSGSARAEFAHRYGAMIRRQLERRWRQEPLRQQIEDALQEVFVECLKPHGALVRAEQARGIGFRRFLGAVVSNVAARVETRLARQHRRHPGSPSPESAPASQTSMAQHVDRAWALGVMREAVEEQERRATAIGAKALLRLKLLRLRFEEGRSIPEVAALWNLPATHVHHQYAKARQDFLKALLVAVERRFPEATREELEERARQLVELLKGR